MSSMRVLATLHLSAFVVLAAWGAAGSSASEPNDPRLEHARRLLARGGTGRPATLQVDQTLPHPEGFAIRAGASGTTICGGGPGGVLYGVQEWLGLAPEVQLPLAQQPDFELRGTVLFLMKEAQYDYQLTPDEFPWFFDRPLLIRYLDYLLENRLNTVFLWSGHLFPSIVQLPEYPDATDLSAADLARNQEQFQWFTNECARRNIRVLVHFYQIHLPQALARARNIPVHYSQPNDFVRRFVRYSLERFLEKFASVGLYVCPGEALRSEYQPEWIRDVIFAAAKASRRNPVIVVRDWTLDAKRFQEVCKDQYENLYTELKHNVEMLVSPVPDARHALWKGVARKHIVNVHELADLKPFRWGSPRFIQEMTREWKQAGVDGAEVYGMISWRWPYALDKLEPQQTSFWPAGRKLLTFERDAIWLEALGRYLWQTNRDPAAEEAYWTARLATKFGNREAGDLFRQWYDLTGPILPGLQNLTHVRNMNFFPTAIGAEQKVDWILAADERVDYPARPVDSYFLERYRQKYSTGALASRQTMPLVQFADSLARGAPPAATLTPDKVVELLAELAEESLALAQRARQAATANQDEGERFISDSQALVYVTQAWRHKILAAIEKRVLLRGGGPEHRQAFRRHLDESLAVYRKLVALTDQTYVNATDMLLRLNWHNGLASFVADAEQQQAWLRRLDAARQPGVYWVETEDMEGTWKLGTNYAGYSGIGFRVSDGPGQRGTVLRHKVVLDQAGRYTVWARGLLASNQDRSFAVEVAGRKYPPTHGERGPPQGEFVWRKVGEAELPKGATEIVVHDAGSGYECPDAIVLARDPTWQPPP